MADTSIFFVETRSSEQRPLLCRWVESLFEQGKSVQVAAGSTTAAQQLNALLWTFSQGSFIPHRILDPSSPPPLPGEVTITPGESVAPGREVLVADGPVHLEFMRCFRWVVHFVLLDDPERLKESRRIWQEAKDLGISPHHVPYGSGPREPG